MPECNISLNKPYINQNHILNGKSQVTVVGQKVQNKFWEHFPGGGNLCNKFESPLSILKSFMSMAPIHFLAWQGELESFTLLPPDTRISVFEVPHDSHWVLKLTLSWWKMLEIGFTAAYYLFLNNNWISVPGEGEGGNHYLCSTAGVPTSRVWFFTKKKWKRKGMFFFGENARKRVCFWAESVLLDGNSWKSQ